MVEARLLFRTDTGKVFNLEHAWGILCYSAKWMKNLDEANRCGKSKAKNASINVNNASTNPLTDPPSSNTNGPPSNATTRPEGQKKAKN
jgi:hypothetical protein